MQKPWHTDPGTKPTSISRNETKTWLFRLYRGRKLINHYDKDPVIKSTSMIHGSSILDAGFFDRGLTSAPGGWFSGVG